MGFLYFTVAIVRGYGHGAEFLKQRFLTGNEERTDWRKKKRFL